jgi:hypothetical protein
LSVLNGPLGTSPLSRTGRSGHRTLRQPTLRVRAGRCAPGAREAGSTRPHPMHGEDKRLLWPRMTPARGFRW